MSMDEFEPLRSASDSMSSVIWRKRRTAFFESFLDLISSKIGKHAEWSNWLGHVGNRSTYVDQLSSPPIGKRGFKVLILFKFSDLVESEEIEKSSAEEHTIRTNLIRKKHGSIWAASPEANSVKSLPFAARFRAEYHSFREALVFTVRAGRFGLPSEPDDETGSSSFGLTFTIARRFKKCVQSLFWLGDGLSIAICFSQLFEHCRTFQLRKGLALLCKRSQSSAGSVNGKKPIRISGFRKLGFSLPTASCSWKSKLVKVFTPDFSGSLEAEWRIWDFWLF